MPSMLQKLRSPILFGSLVLAVVSLGSTGCTQDAAEEEPRDETTSDIIGGSPTDAYPAVGAIIWMNKKSFCSAFLVAPRLVMTAAHCLKDKGTTLPDGFFVGPGSRVTNPTSIPNGFTRHEVDAMTYHPKFGGGGDSTTRTLDKTLSDFSYDLGLIRLKTAITDIKPLPVGAHSGNYRDKCTLVGYGFDAAGNNPGFLRKRTAKSAILRLINDHTEVVNAPLQGDAAKGDSGSPLLCDEGVVRGVYSFFFGTTNVDDRDFYAHTADKRPWVNEIATKWNVTGIAQ